MLPGSAADAVALITHLGSLTSSLRMKSFASSVMFAKAALSKSHSPSFTLSRVSRGVFAWNGETPLNLQRKTHR